MIHNIDEYKQKYYNIFKEKYNSLILKNGEKWEKKRKVYLKRQLIAITIIFLIITSCFIGPYSIEGNAVRELIKYMHHSVAFVTLDIKLIFTLIVSMSIKYGLIMIASAFINSISEDIKKELLNDFGKIIENFHFGIVDSDNIYTNDELKNSYLFAQFNTMSSDDNFIGNYKGLNFKISEVTLTDEHCTAKGEKCYIVFNGIVGKIITNNFFKTLTLITSKKDDLINNTLPTKNIIATLIVAFILCPIFLFIFYPEMFQNIFLILSSFVIMFCLVSFICGILYFAKSCFTPQEYMQNLQKIDIGNKQFNKYYTVYAENCIESRSLISQSLISALNNMENIFGTKNIKISFYQNNIVFAIKTSFWSCCSAFELGNNFISIYDYKFVRKFFDEIISILIIIDILNETISLSNYPEV